MKGLCSDSLRTCEKGNAHSDPCRNFGQPQGMFAAQPRVEVIDHLQRQINLRIVVLCRTCKHPLVTRLVQATAILGDQSPVDNELLR